MVKIKNIKNKIRSMPDMNNKKCSDCEEDLYCAVDIVEIAPKTRDYRAIMYCLKCGIPHIRPIIESEIDTYRYISKNHTSFEFHELHLSGRIYPNLSGNMEKVYYFYMSNEKAIDTILAEHEEKPQIKKEINKMTKTIAGVKCYDLEDLKEELGLTIVTLRKYMRDGTIKGQKVGVSWLITEDNLKAYLNDSHSIQGTPHKPHKK